MLLILFGLCMAPSSTLAIESDCFGAKSLAKQSKAESQINEWLPQVEDKIKQNEHFVDVKNRLTAELSDGDYIVVIIKVAKSGIAREIKSFNSNKDDFSEAEKQVSKLVRGSAPFDKPPNSLTNSRGIRIVFEKRGKEIKLRAVMNFLNVTIKNAHERLNPAKIRFYK